MKFIITGINSFIGQELLAALLQKGHEVVAVSRSKPVTPAPIDYVCADMSEYGELYKQIDSADVFINLAWRGSAQNGRNDVAIQKDNIRDTLKAIDAAQQMKCKLFVQAGSQAEYGSVTTDISETTPCHPFSEYGKAKLEVQKQAFALCEKYSMKYIHLRIFSIYGENDHPWTLVMSSLKKMLLNETVALSSCLQYWNFLYVKDAVSQILSLCDYALKTDDFSQEVYNIASEDTRILKDFVEEMKVRSKSDSFLDYGVIHSPHNVSLKPNMMKTKTIVGTLSFHTFGEIIELIISKIKNTEL